MPTPRDRPLDALGLARSGAVIERGFPIAGFTRLRDRLATTDGSAAARAVFRLHQGSPTAALTVRAEVVLVCQRCLGPVRHALESEAHLAFAPEDTPDLPVDHEAIGGDPRRVDLAALVEDELLLSLPLIPQHAQREDCGLPAAAPEAPAEPKPVEMRRPFAGLKELLKH